MYGWDNIADKKTKKNKIGDRYLGKVLDCVFIVEQQNITNKITYFALHCKFGKSFEKLLRNRKHLPWHNLIDSYFTRKKLAPIWARKLEPGK